MQQYDDPCDDWGSHLIVEWRWPHYRQPGKSMIGDAMQAWHDPKYIDMEIEKHLACSAMGHDWGIAKYYHRSTLVLPMTDDPNERATFIGLPVLKVRICKRCGEREETEIEI